MSVSGVVVSGALILLAAYSFYEAQRLPSGCPDRRNDWRIVIGGLALVPFCLSFVPTFRMPILAFLGLGVPCLLAIALGTFPGMIYQLAKARRLRWASRPNKLSKAEHKQADAVEFAFHKLIHDVGVPYQVSRSATEEGLERIKELARWKAKEFFAITGQNIEMDIDRWLHRRWKAVEAVKTDSA
ncbi:hypothetical protein [Pseudomonas sp. PLMAX]|uniref:hypothetical protein n=1 Tax=Pseudomonas sp. PLMAX TaxID=2201998 RepID=UPI0038BCE9D6